MLLIGSQIAASKVDLLNGYYAKRTFNFHEVIFPCSKRLTYLVFML